MKLLSLFDGSGGFPLAGAMCGITPVAASEVEPYPIAVTKSRFPSMKHLGDVCKVNGAEIDPVDVLTFGFPCQDVSVAGKRAGVKHEDNGDDETTRSGLLWEAVRIIEEMRGATNGEYPKFAVFENVPGLFSADKGEAFRTVVEGLIKIVEPTAVMPNVPKKGWAYADCYVGNGWSFAYRVFDAQYIRTAQRRRRLYAVLDLGGQRARQILFEREGLRGYSAESGEAWQGTPAATERGVGADDSEGAYGFPLGFRPENVRCYEEKATTLCNGTRAGFCNGVVVGIDGYNGDIVGDKSSTLGVNCRMVSGRNGVLIEKEQTPFCKSHRAVSADDATTWKHAERANTINTFDQGETRVNELVVAVDRAFFNQGKNAQYEPQTYEDGTTPTLVARGPSAVAYGIGNGQSNQGVSEEKVGALNCMHDQQAVAVPSKPYYIVRRLTPTECARLQGFPDAWGHVEKKSDFTDEEYRFWLDVRNTHAEINGKAVKDYTKKQMLTWYNKLWTDSAEYKMWGNGIALPCALYVMEGIAEVLKGEK